MSFAHSLTSFVKDKLKFEGPRVYSGSDDCKLKCFAVDGGGSRPAFVIKEHTMGVTSLLSDVQNEFRLYSGSYDENLHFWDTRSELMPILNKLLGVDIT